MTPSIRWLDPFALESSRPYQLVAASLVCKAVRDWDMSLAGLLTRNPFIIAIDGLSNHLTAYVTEHNRSTDSVLINHTDWHGASPSRLTAEFPDNNHHIQVVILN